MKIRTGLETVYCMEGHPDFETLMMFQNLKETPDKLLQKIEEHLSIKFNCLISLYDWVDVLNVLDEQLKNILNKHAIVLLLQETNGYPIKEFLKPTEEFLTAEYKADIHNLKIILKFYQNLMPQSFGKEFFSSTEVNLS